MRRRTLDPLLVYLILFVGFMTGTIGGRLYLDGKLDRWISLGSPPEPAARILGAGWMSHPSRPVYRGRETYLYVESASGRVYYYCGSEGDRWQEVDRTAVESWTTTDCSTNNEPAVAPPRGVIQEATVHWCSEWDWGQANFVIRNDGTVWRLQTHGAFPNWLVPFCGWPIAGMLLGAVVAWIAARIVKWRTAEENRDRAQG